MGSETQAREQRVSCTTRAAPPESLLQSLAEVELAPDKVISEGLTIELPGGARLVLNHPDKPRSPPPSLTIYPARIMLSFSGGLKIFVALEPCDMRKSVMACIQQCMRNCVPTHLAERSSCFQTRTTTG